MYPFQTGQKILTPTNIWLLSSVEKGINCVYAMVKSLWSTQVCINFSTDGIMVHKLTSFSQL